MFATRRFTDGVGTLDGGIPVATFSASTVVSSGNILDLSRFQKYVFVLQVKGAAAGNKTIALYSCSTSASSISSASSNWAQIDSASCIATVTASSTSSTGNAFGVLEVRAEKLFSGVSPIRYVRPVITTGSGVASNSIDSVSLIVLGLLPKYGTASDYASGSLGAPVPTTPFETDYL